MTEERCEKYLEEPELLAEHAQSCASCGERMAVLDRVDATIGRAAVGGISVSRELSELPLAPWEAARHRSWGIAIGAAAVLVIFAALGFAVAGISPVAGFAAAFRAALSPRFNPISVATSVSALVRQAPVSFHIAVGIAFVVVNAIFLALLRRAPKGGYDA